MGMSVERPPVLMVGNFLSRSSGALEPRGTTFGRSAWQMPSSRWAHTMHQPRIGQPGVPNMTVDLVICTYRRVPQLTRLVRALLDQTLQPARLIVVDSSPNHEDVRRALCGTVPTAAGMPVLLVSSSHANIAYQRWLGYKTAQGDLLAYLDDDVVPLATNMLQRLVELFADDRVAGASVGIDCRNPLVQDPDLTSLTNRLRSNPFLGRVQVCVDWLTGLPRPGSGELGLCGVQGPAGQGLVVQVPCLPGGCMAFRRECLRDACFPADLLAIFEKRLGIGEDRAMSYSAQTNGLLLLNEILLLHPGDAPTVAYPAQIRSCARAAAYSRLFLSRLVAERRGLSTLRYRLHYYWYAAWRAIGAASRVPLPPYRKHWAYLIGWLQGVLLTITKPPSHEALTPRIDWDADAARDCERAELLVPAAIPAAEG